MMKNKEIYIEEQISLVHFNKLLITEDTDSMLKELLNDYTGNYCCVIICSIGFYWKLQYGSIYIFLRRCTYRSRICNGNGAYFGRKCSIFIDWGRIQ